MIMGIRSPRNIISNRSENFDDFFFAVTDASFSGDLSSFMAELEGSSDSFFFKSAPSSDTAQYAFVRKSDRKIIGFVQYRPECFYTEGSIGYIVRPSERNKGYSKKMIKNFIFFISLSGVPFLSAKISKDNIFSIKAAESSGGILLDDLSSDDSCFYYFKCVSDAFVCEIEDHILFIESEKSLFSPYAPDKGTLAMLSGAVFNKGEKILDLGCGTGIVGIFACKKLSNDCTVIQCDISSKAVKCAVINNSFNNTCANAFVSDGFANVEDNDFDMILSNPPYHTDFSVAKHFIEDGFKHLKVGGRFYMVTKRLDWYKNKFTSVFGGVKVAESDGYYIFTAEKRTARPPVKKKDKGGMSSKLKRKYGIKQTVYHNPAISLIYS